MERNVGNRIGATLLAAAVFLAAPVTAAIAEGASATLEKIRESGVVTIGHREASVPFSYLDEEGEPTGYSVELCLHVVEAVRQRLEMPELDVKWVPVVPQTRIQLIANRTIDMECGSSTNNLTRQKHVDYLATTFITGTKIAVKKGSGIQNIKDLDGKSIAVSFGTTNDRAVRAAMEQHGLDINVVNTKDHPQGWLALETGRVDAYSTDDVLLYGLISRSKTPENFEVTGDYLSFDPYGIMVPRDDSEFRLIGNTVLASLMRSGEIETIYNKWFSKVNLPLSDRMATAFANQALPE